MQRIKDFVKREVTLCVAFFAALASCFFVPPDRAYFGYADIRTLALLYCLMVVVAGLRRAGLFSSLAHFLCGRVTTVRSIGLVLTALCFFLQCLLRTMWRC